MTIIRQIREADPALETWIGQLEALGDCEVEVTLPPAEQLPSILLDLAVPHEDIDDLVALRPLIARSPDLWWLLERCASLLIRSMGSVVEPQSFQALPVSLGPLQRYFYIYVFVAVLPHVRAFHRQRGIADVISRRTLADLGRNMAVHRRRHGYGGLETAGWLMGHFRGALYELGRLQWARAWLGNRTGRGILAAGQPHAPGDPALEIHVPAFYGPLSPQACDASIAAARNFFAAHFPDEHYPIATCHSWLLDQQLAEYLPPASNIISFQRRFQIAYRMDEDDADILLFVFGKSAPSIDDLPQRTLLQRAIVAHIRAGRHWRSAAGWFLL